jgi:very-short-patch-repair endonuclease
MQGQTNPKILATQLQRNLRNHPTNAEHRLWQRLRNRQIEKCKFRRQHPFGDFIVDFVCLERRVIVELDGSQHASNTPYDRSRTSFLNKSGFIVLRFWNNQVLEDIDGVLGMIWQTLIARETPSPPNPPLEGEG